MRRAVIIKIGARGRHVSNSLRRFAAGKRGEQTGQVTVTRTTLVKIFLRALLVHGSWTISRMQGLGFAAALFPLADGLRDSGLLTRHLQRFNTHPYLAASIIGSVARLETDGRPQDAIELKTALMGPYAAIGDSFFWSALKPFSAVAAVCLASQGLVIAPLLYLILYTPVQAWVRLGGFRAGWNEGRNGIEFVRRLELLEKGRLLRWSAAVLLAAATYGFSANAVEPVIPLTLIGKIETLIIILAVFFAVNKGVSPIVILYGAVLFFSGWMVFQ